MKGKEGMEKNILLDKIDSFINGYLDNKQVIDSLSTSQTLTLLREFESTPSVLVAMYVNYNCRDLMTACKEFAEVIITDDLTKLTFEHNGFKLRDMFEDLEDFKRCLYSEDICLRGYLAGDKSLCLKNGDQLIPFGSLGVFMQVIEDDLTECDGIGYHSGVYGNYYERYKDMYEDYFIMEFNASRYKRFNLYQEDISKYVEYLTKDMEFDGFGKSVTFRIGNDFGNYKVTNQGLETEHGIVPRNWIEFYIAYDNMSLFEVLCDTFLDGKFNFDVGVLSNIKSCFF